MRETINCSLDTLGDVIAEMVGEFRQEVINELKIEAKERTEELEKTSKADAPTDRGKYKRAIASKVVKETPTSITCAWYVKAPHHRLTHLIIKGHALKNGGRTRANPFLQRNYEQVKTKYERNCEKVIEDAAG